MRMLVMVKEHLALIFLLISSAHGFLAQIKPIDGLADICHNLDGTELDVRLAVGNDLMKNKPAEQDMFHLQGMKIALSAALDTMGRNLMGPASVGSYAADVNQAPFFTDLNVGRQIVDFTNGRWELLWRDILPKGNLVCEFEVVKGAHRRDIILPAGKLYLSHDIWTAEGYQVEKEKHEQYEELARKYMERRDTELQLYKESNNWFKKALHYRKALEAVELLSFTAPRNFPGPNEIIRVANDFVVAAKGRIFAKKGSFDNKVLLGQSTISANFAPKTAAVIASN